MLFKMMYYADPFDGKLGILNARYRTPDYPPFSVKMHDLLNVILCYIPYMGLQRGKPSARDL